jgi:hypothetical protein
MSKDKSIEVMTGEHRNRIIRLHNALEGAENIGEAMAGRYAESLRVLLDACSVEQHEAAPTGYCERAGGCVCGGDLPRVREGCSEWVSTKPQHEAARSEKRYNGRTAADLREICSTRPARYPAAHHDFDKTILALLDDIEQPTPSAPLEGTGNGAETCKTCGGSRVVNDGEITGSGGVEFENGPIRCVKDCPDCTYRAPRTEVAGAVPSTDQIHAIGALVSLGEAMGHEIITKHARDFLAACARDKNGHQQT